MKLIQNGVISKEATSLTTRPHRGEVWIVNLDPTVGSEMKKTRRVVVVSSDAIGKLPIKLIAPFTEWQVQFESSIWMVPVEPTDANGLTKKSAVDTLQVRGVDIQRFRTKEGRLSEDLMGEITAAIATVIEYS